MTKREWVEFFLRVNLPAAIAVGCYTGLFDPSPLGILKGIGIVWVPCFTILWLLNYMVGWEDVVSRVRKISVRGKERR